METVFDYNITDEEREYLGITGEGMIYAATHYEYTANLCLASLFSTPTGCRLVIDWIFTVQSRILRFQFL